MYSQKAQSLRHRARTEWGRILISILLAAIFSRHGIVSVPGLFNNAWPRRGCPAPLHRAKTCPHIRKYRLSPRPYMPANVFICVLKPWNLSTRRYLRVAAGGNESILAGPESRVRVGGEVGGRGRVEHACHHQAAMFNVTTLLIVMISSCQFSNVEDSKYIFDEQTLDLDYVELEDVQL